MENKLVVVITHPNRSEILPVVHAIHLNLTVANSTARKLPSQTVNHFPKSIVIDIPANIMEEINDYKNKLKSRDDEKVIEGDDEKIMEDDDEKPMEDDDEESYSEDSLTSNVHSFNDPNILFKVSATITYMFGKNDVKKQTAKRAAIQESNWFGLHSITLCSSSGTQ
ncbi:unnamed protein product [Rotaria sordida]|uniref:Uncharacterized protein n=1 Tax=Rotaria sordida TaxID=392033 RepID=A0A815RZE7_9BILA|nr:unnamed protein product [Rotaria sordida]CAF1513753.1 unnamed protein product [Rotaria sordida]CAF1649058.1 unnamed protein product [Rotaria sordida]CAF4119637.1 unnamed protein product [Rotaria sordida]